jgi:hypothetical protein
MAKCDERKPRVGDFLVPKRGRMKVAKIVHGESGRRVLVCLEFQSPDLKRLTSLEAARLSVLHLVLTSHYI